MVDPFVETPDETVNLKCELCIFETKSKPKMERHKFKNHSVKGKYICIQCKQEFDNIAELYFIVLLGY